MGRGPFYLLLTRHGTRLIPICREKFNSRITIIVTPGADPGVHHGVWAIRLWGAGRYFAPPLLTFEGTMVTVASPLGSAPAEAS